MFAALTIEASADGRALDHPGKARSRARHAALADEDEGVTADSQGAGVVVPGNCVGKERVRWCERRGITKC